MTLSRLLLNYWYVPIKIEENYISQEKNLYKNPSFLNLRIKKEKQYSEIIILDSVIREINSTQTVKSVLQSIYGIGLSRASKVGILFDFGKACLNFHTLTAKHREIIINTMDSKRYKVKQRLKIIRQNNIDRLRLIKCYKGLRHALYLPVRGQRTHSNAHVARYLGSGTFFYVSKRPSTKSKKLSKYSRRKPHLVSQSLSRYSRLLNKHYHEFMQNNPTLYKQLQRKNKLGVFTQLNKDKIKNKKLKAKKKTCY